MDMRGTGVVRNVADMRGSGVVCDESCGCPSPCPGGIPCRCYNASSGRGEADHKKCSCGEHCGCNPCTACDKSGVAGAGCKCGAGCSCTSCK